MSLHTTLNRLKLAGACGQTVGSGEGYDKLRVRLGKGWKKDSPIDLLTILESNGLDDTHWCLQATQEDSSTVVRLLVADYLEHLCLALVPDDSKALLSEGVALLRDPAVTDAALLAYGDKAREAAGAAAREAAGAAERMWQTQRLREYLAKVTP